MLTDFYATKKGMTQAWTTEGKRLAVTRLQADDMVVARVMSATQIELGIGNKKSKNVSKPLRIQHEKNKLSVLPAKVVGATWSTTESENEVQSGSPISVTDVLRVGDVVSVSGTSKGRGFGGVVKRYGFKGGPKTHGQSDRTRAVGSVGAGTTPGRVFKGKRMPGHYGVETKTVSGLLIVHIDEQDKEVWVSGPVPGHINSVVKISTTGSQQPVKLDLVASHIKVAIEPTANSAVTEEDAQEDAQEQTQADVPSSLDQDTVEARPERKDAESSSSSEEEEKSEQKDPEIVEESKP